MDNETSREFERVNRRLDKHETAQEELEGKVHNLNRDVARFWYTGVGIAVGFIVKELGIEKLLGHLL